MKKALIAAILTLGIIASIGYVSYANRPVPPPPVSHVYTPEELLVEANKLRAEKGVAPLKLDAKLNESAQWKAQDMADRDYFDHKDPSSGIVNGIGHYWSLKTGKCRYVSENLEEQRDKSPFSPFARWANSPPHYSAIIDPDNTYTGFGIVNDSGRVLYVQHFCKPY